MKVLCQYLLRDDHFEGDGWIMIEVNKIGQVQKRFDERMISLNHKKAFAPRKIDGWIMTKWLPESLAFGKLRLVEGCDDEETSRHCR